MKLKSLFDIMEYRNIARFIICLPVSFFLRKKHPSVWLIAERPDQARDNGYCFFRYLREQHPEIEAYYVITDDASDRKKPEPLGNIIRYDSWKHILYFCLSRVHISAHDNMCAPSNSVILRYLRKHMKYKNVFLPHGVSYGISEFCLAKWGKFDLFICSGEPEYQNVLAHYGYRPEQVAYTGFPRLDSWHDCRVNPKQIVLMPTWRMYLAQNPETAFEETEYFHAYSELLGSERLHRFLTENDLHLVFYLHNDMRKYQKFFTADCENIEIVRRDGQWDIQELLKSSALLITDYSSVCFDFAYMDKPVLYYQFDRETFFEKQYQKGDFDAERDGFGPVCTELSVLLDNLEEAYKNNFAMPEKYHARMRNFYRLYDTHNCDRVLEVIQERIEKI